jgi:hypothetical protein
MLDPHAALVGRRHPEYGDLLSHWNFLYDTYIGGRDWFTDHIFKYHKEGTEEFTARVERAYRFNHTREVVDLVTKYLFKASIARSEDVSEEVQQFQQSPSGARGQGIQQFIRDVGTRSGIYGRVYVVVDDSMQEAPLTKADEKRAGSNIYAYTVSPQRALDMSFDKHGELNWILFREDYRVDEDPFEVNDPAVRYRLWTRNEWYLFTPRTVEAVNGAASNVADSGIAYDMESGTHGLGVVPVVIADHITSDESPYASPSMISDVAYLDRACANYLSNLDAIIQDQTFSQLVIPAQSLPFSLDGAVSQQQKAMVEMGTKRIFTYDSSNGAPPPKYISPDVRQAELIVTVVRQIINEIYHSVGVAGERTKQDNAMGIDNSSGVAKAYDFDRVNSLLTAKALTLQSVENQIYALVDLRAGNNVSENYVTYPKDFDVRGLADEFDVASNLSMIDAPDSVRQQQMEQLIEKLFPSLKASIKKEMIASLKDWPAKVGQSVVPVMPFASDDRSDDAASDE